MSSRSTKTESMSLPAPIPSPVMFGVEPRLLRGARRLLSILPFSPSSSLHIPISLIPPAFAWLPTARYCPNSSLPSTECP